MKIFDKKMLKLKLPAFPVPLYAWNISNYNKQNNETDM